MYLKCKILMFLPAKSGQKQNGETWTMNSFVTETFGEYPKKVVFQSFKSITVEIGNIVDVHFNLESKESPKTPDQWFTSATAYKIDVEGTVASTPTTASEVVAAEVVTSDEPPF